MRFHAWLSLTSSTVLLGISLLGAIRPAAADGAAPLANLVQGIDGSFYGTTSAGGATGWGTVFKTTSKGATTLLHSFTGKDGKDPVAHLIQATDGAFYGTTPYGGANNTGSIFKITSTGALTTLYSFSATSNVLTGANSDGAYPLAGLVQTSDGTLYGTTSHGGAYGDGTVFKVTTAGALTTLHTFQSSSVNPGPAWPEGGLAVGKDGALYGITYSGGSSNDGAVFKITTGGALTVLHQFTNSDGSGPRYDLTLAPDGNFYGVVTGGGSKGAGGIFKVSPSGALTLVYSFGSHSQDGYYVQGGLALASNGNLYGTTTAGGQNNAGTIYQVTTGGSVSFFYSFPAQAFGPDANGLFVGADGLLYGTSFYGGANNGGSVFSLPINGTPTTLTSFEYTDGSNSLDLFRARNGTVYGVAEEGGANGAGAVYSISSTGIYSLLYSFSNDSNGFNTDGAQPRGLTQLANGHLRGIAYSGGNSEVGTAFDLTPKGAFTLLDAFSYSAGASPLATPVLDRSSNLYGTTDAGGAHGDGALYEIASNGGLTNLYSFAGSDGNEPTSVLLDGTVLYGTTFGGGTDGSGVVFKFNLTSGVESTLYSFTNGNDGRWPNSLAMGKGGVFYGTTQSGGSNSAGTVFKVTSKGVLTTLHTFIGNDGMTPRSLIAGADGNFYGVTEGGGQYLAGTVFQLTPAGALTTLYMFSGPDGSAPFSLSQGADGLLYGTTTSGGIYQGGTAFKIDTKGNLTTLHDFFTN
jgi:uncharacterized repeat protein (TIGR03803 family)